MAKQLGTGGIAFLVGIIGAALLGFMTGFGAITAGAWLTTLLIGAGLLIGFINMNAREAVPIMIASLVLGVGALVLTALPAINAVLATILSNLAVLVLPAGLVIAIKTIYDKAR
ncbi:MAG: hypothetical protein DRP42_03265 [Tenericutes bacterium]|nr:MAG: hypothetical protein DRP42_03265 [Mycoplasmatota bacterium]